MRWKEERERCGWDEDQGESELSAKLKVGRASLGEEKEGSRVADISINAAWDGGGVQKGKTTTTSQRHLAAHGLFWRWDGMGWDGMAQMERRGESAVRERASDQGT
jgi:hypothetical protein